MTRAAQVTPRTLTGWLFTATLRGMVTGVLFPMVVAIGLVAWVATRWIDPPELPPGTTTSSTEFSLQGTLAGVGYFGLLTMIASSVGAVVGAAVGLVVGAVCALFDVLTRRRLDAVVVALVGAAVYVVAAVVTVSVPPSSLPVALLVAGPGVLGALTLKAVPLHMGPPVRSLAMTSVMRIRPAAPGDGERLREIERAAGERFREVDLAAIAEDEPMTIGQLTAYADAGRSWVATIEPDRRERVVGYVVVQVVDGNAHVEQLSVDPDAQGRGIGRALLDRADEYARMNGLAAVTLTTFRDVAWNAPLYAHLGFRELTPAEIGPELAALVEVEASHGRDPDQRVCMQRSL